MAKKNNALIASILAGGTLLLASCTPLHPDYPTDYAAKVVTVTDGQGNEITVPFNYKKQYYQDIGTTSTAALNRILDTIASKVSLGEVKDAKNDDAVLNLYSSEKGEDAAASVAVPYVTGLSDDGSAFETADLEYKGLTAELDKRAKKAFVERVNTGSFDVNNRFDEKKFILNINQNALAGIQIPADFDNESVVINKTSTYDEVFQADYSDYIAKETYWTPIENKLTAQFIYNERYSSIYNANARKVSIVALADRSDDKGAAKALIEAYKADYLAAGKTIDPAYADNPLAELALLWKGIGGYTDKTAADMPTTGLDAVPEEYENFLTAAQKAFLDEYSLANLYDGVQDDLSKINLKNALLSDSTLEADYTGSNTYDLAEGRIRHIDSIVKKDVLTEGIFQRSDLSSLPSDVVSRIFATDTDSNRLEVGDHKFVTPALSAPDSSNDITLYDKSTDTYYLVMMDDSGLFDRSHLKDKAANEADPTLRAAAMDVAYKMVTASTYRTEGTVYWLKKFAGKGKLTVNNQTFYDYLNSNYPDLFDDDADEYW